MCLWINTLQKWPFFNDDDGWWSSDKQKHWVKTDIFFIGRHAFNDRYKKAGINIDSGFFYVNYDLFVDFQQSIYNQKFMMENAIFDLYDKVVHPFL